MTIKGKAARSRLKYEKLTKIQQLALDGYIDGLVYESGVALAAALKVAKCLPSQKPNGIRKGYRRINVCVNTSTQTTVPC